MYGNGNGSNEQGVGEIIEKLGYRDKVYFSTKMNRLAIHKREDMDKMFEEQLSNLRTDHIDYYFIHGVITLEDLEKLINIGLFDFIKERKERGQIINIGFSYHGSYEDFKKIVDIYDWDATIVQYNYIDGDSQVGSQGIQYANDHDMAVIIMEPLKGGLLAGTLPKEAEDKIKELNINKSNADLAFNWILQNQNITCILSGMNTMDMVEENVAIFSKEEALKDDELELLEEIRQIILKLNKVNCTSCNYCMPCPKGVNIPYTFKLYNDKYLFPDSSRFGLSPATAMYAVNLTGLAGEQQKDVSLCVDCGLCVKKCPQQLDIPDLLRQADKEFHGGLLRTFKPLLKRIMKIIM